jgi:2-polyprenyl-3-methyl-5-hydroxy-6-metoxy-1,4-benzoquinol methylase
VVNAAEAVRASLAERLRAFRDDVPDSLLDVTVRREGGVYLVMPADWDQLRHDEGGAGRGVPYWARPWPAGIALAEALAADPPPPGARVLELGCGLAAPSVAAARAGARVLATDASLDAVVFAAHCLALNEVEGEVAQADWAQHGDELVRRGPWDLVIASDVLYTRANVDAARAKQWRAKRDRCCSRAWARRSCWPIRTGRAPATSWRRRGRASA